MKNFSSLLWTVLLMASGSTCAGVIVGGTRLIYDGGKKESSLSISNQGKAPYLIQSWVESSAIGTKSAPFMVTPPLFRLSGGQDNMLRVVHTGIYMPTDRESLYWINIKSIPSVSSENPQNTLQIAVRTRIKLIYRPQSLKGTPEEQAEKLVWQRRGSSLYVTNPTPFYMNFHQVKVGGQELSGVTYVAPMSTKTFPLPVGRSGKVSWKIISDYGGVGNEYTGPS